MSKQALVCDTTLLLYLARIGQVQLLPALFEPVFAPQSVVWELDSGRSTRPDTVDPRSLDWLTVVDVTQAELGQLPPNRLGNGERAVIACARARPECVAGLDDRQARLLAEQLNLPVVGTVGILLKAKKVGLVPSVRVLLDAVSAQGFRISDDLYHEAVGLVGE